MTTRPPERGMALVAVTMTLVLVLAIGAGLAMATSAEAMIAANYRSGQQALYAAEAAAEWAVADLPAVAADWPALLGTTLTSTFVDGAPGGSRRLSDGSYVDLNDAVARNAAWKAYAWGPLIGLLPPLPFGLAVTSPFYIVIFVAPDEGSPDGILVRTEAYGPRGAHKMLELRLLRDAAGVHVASWAERR